MLPVEQHISERYPRWFRGPIRPVSRAVVRGVAKISRLNQISGFLSSASHLRGFDFVNAAIDYLGCRWQSQVCAGEGIPEKGRLIIVANHPSGAIDSLSLLQYVGSIRKDVKIVANDVLWSLEPLRDLLLPIRILGGRPTAESLKNINDALESESCVIIYPAGEVSRLSFKGVRDTRWRTGFIRFAHETNTPVLPIRIAARNSAFFYGASTLFKPAGTVLLAREMFARARKMLTLRVGEAKPLPKDIPPRKLLRQVRRELYALKLTKQQKRALKRLDGQREEPIIAPVSPDAWQPELANMPLLGHTLDGQEIRCGQLQAASPLMREIGRLREETFRAVGEGTGQSIDLDVYDTWYQHIVLFDPKAERIVGAYRFVTGSSVLDKHGIKGFYSASLFHFDESALPRLRQGMELGRSFVVQDYWGSRSIDYLWQGIGAFLQKNPQVRYLFGPVSISAALPTEAREQIVAYYQQFYGAEQPYAEPMQPFLYRDAPPEFETVDCQAAFKMLRNNLSACGAAVPMLYKQYTDLCEPGGAKFLAFGVDPAFADAIDGLIEVDLTYIREKKRKRYLEPRAQRH